MEEKKRREGDGKREKGEERVGTLVSIPTSLKPCS